MKRSGIMKIKCQTKEEYLKKEQSKIENKDFIVIDNMREFIPMPQYNIVYKMPLE